MQLHIKLRKTLAILVCSTMKVQIQGQLCLYMVVYYQM